MKINELKVKPTLIEITIDDPKIIEKYGEEVKFYMLDHLTLPMYFAFYQAQNSSDIDKLLDLMREIILDEHGKTVLDKEHELPIDLFSAAVAKVTDQLGKSETKNSTQKETGTPQ